MHQNYHFIVMLSQMLLHVSAHQCHHQGAHMIVTGYFYDGAHYNKIMKYQVKQLQSVILHYGYKWMRLTVAGSSGLLWNMAMFHNSPVKLYFSSCHSDFLGKWYIYYTV
jgi:hypothetical protein